MPIGDFTKTSDGYSTHQKLLVRYALMAPEGSNIVEMGVGMFSTPILSEIATVRKLNLFVYHQDEQWANKVKEVVNNPRINWTYVDDWSKWKPKESAYFYFLDNEELVINRYQQIAKIKPYCSYVIIHDADTYPKRGVDLNAEEIIAIDKTQTPHTAVIRGSSIVKVSQKSDCPRLFELLTMSAQEYEDENSPSNLEEQYQQIKDGTVKRERKIAVVCGYVPGGDYDEHYAEYIERLYKGFKNNSTVPFDFHCISIFSPKIEGVNFITPLNGNWKGWHIKAEIFRQDLFGEYDRVLWCDLDTVIRDNIDDILTNEDEISLLHDFNRTNILETGLIWYNPKLFDGLYEKFIKLNPRQNLKDAKIITDYIKQQGYTPTVLQKKYKIGSYKVSLIKNQRDPKEYQIVCFHGVPRPHQVNWNLAVSKDTRLIKKSSIKQKDVEPIFEGQELFIIGGGPSLTNIDLDRFLSDKNVLGINDGYLYDCCDFCYFGDTVWWHHHKDELFKRNIPVYTTSKVDEPKINHLGTKPNGLSECKSLLGWNHNSGMAGINLGIHFGAKRIFLLGYDMGFGKEGESNWHPNIRRVNSNSYKVMLRNEKRINIDWKQKFNHVDIINVEMPGYTSNLKIFPKINFNEIFEVDKNEIYKKEQV